MSAADEGQHLPYDAAALDAFWMPGRDSGIYRLGPATPPWTKSPCGTVASCTITNSPRITRLWNRGWDELLRDRWFTSPVETAVGPAVVENLAVRDSHLSVNGKWLTTGPAGARLLGAVGQAAKRARGKPAAVEELNAFFSEASKNTQDLPLWDADISGLDFVIEARNLKNYFHFVRETFAILSLIDELKNFTGRIVIVAKDRDVPAFVQAHIAAIFPELEDRIVVEQAPARFKRALIAHYSDTSYVHDRGNWIDGLIPAHQDLSDGQVDTNLARIIYLNSFQRSLRTLREAAFKRIEGMSFDYLPKRFWVSRRAGQGNDRTIENEGQILRQLAPLGFRQILFEDLSPLEQVGIMRDADMMVSYHGAGFTNMLYAGSQARIIELGTLQTARQRLDDFAAFVHVSRADYTVAVADFPEEFGTSIPPMRGHGIYSVRMSEAAIANLVGLIQSF